MSFAQQASKAAMEWPALGLLFSPFASGNCSNPVCLPCGDSQPVSSWEISIKTSHIQIGRESWCSGCWTKALVLWTSGMLSREMLVFHVWAWSKYFSPIGRNVAGMSFFSKYPFAFPILHGKTSLPSTTDVVLGHMTCTAQWSMSGCDLNHVQAEAFNGLGRFC